MFKLLVLFTHLLATCAALGTIIAVESAHLRQLARGRLQLAAPSRNASATILGALVLLYVSGALLIVLGLGERPDTLQNPKLQGKLLLVGLLTLNAIVLHRGAFGVLGRRPSPAHWSFGERLLVVLPASLSNALWLYCAFLGIARPWNYVMPLEQVLGLAVACLALAVLLAFSVVGIAARQDRRAQADYSYTSASGSVASSS